MIDLVRSPRRSARPPQSCSRSVRSPTGTAEGWPAPHATDQGELVGRLLLAEQACCEHQEKWLRTALCLDGNRRQVVLDRLLLMRRVQQAVSRHHSTTAI